jgi:hypothetical protein
VYALASAVIGLDGTLRQSCGLFDIENTGVLHKMLLETAKNKALLCRV